jgi:hypothetical protein
MALLFMDSFDHYDNTSIYTKWTSQGLGQNFATGRHGSLGRKAYSLYKGLPAASGSTAIAGFAIYWDGGSALDVLCLDGPGGVQVGVTFQTNGNIYATRGIFNDPVLGQSGAGTIAAYNWYYLEVKVFIDNSAGTLEVRLNGTPIITVTGADTQATSDALFNGFSISGSGKVVFDDLYVCDGSGSDNNDFLGDCRVDAHFPTADGATHTFTPSTGSDHYAMVDEEAPDDDTTYNAAASSSLKDTLEVDDFKNTGGVIYGAQVLVSAKKSDAGASSLCPVVRHNSTDNDGTAVALSTSYNYVRQIYEQNPNGGSPTDWTESDFNAAEFGYKKTV